MTLVESLWDDVRFNGNTAYLTDAGAAAIGILDLTTGQQRRVLEYSQFTTSWFPASAEGIIRQFANGSYLYLHVDQLEVSPDGVWLYFRTLPQISRIHFGVLGGLCAINKSILNISNEGSNS